MNSYARFSAMIATAIVTMLVLMYLSTYPLNTALFNETRVYVALMMGAALAIILLSFLRPMYPDRRVNVAIIGGSLLVLFFALWLVRNDTGVDELTARDAALPSNASVLVSSEKLPAPVGKLN